MQHSTQSTADQQAQEVQQIINRARQQAREFLGTERIAELHRSIGSYDLLAVLAALLLLLINTTLLVSPLLAALPPLATVLLTTLLVLIQGWWLQIAGLISHDLFVHRRVGGERLAAWGSLLLTLPRLSLPLGYQRAHLAHHRLIGSAADTEHYKQAINTPLRRLAFSTLPGVLWFQSGRARQDGRAYRQVTVDQGLAAADAARLKRERLLLRSWLVLMIIATALAPLPLLLAYWIPLLVVAPLINSVRIIIEHADADVAVTDAWQLGTNYRTGWLTRLMFLNDAGDCHLVHHIFPRMPFYHVGHCVDALRPLIDQHNPRQRTSLLALLAGWYFAGYGHRTPWPVAEQGVRVVASSPQR